MPHTCSCSNTIQWRGTRSSLIKWSALKCRCKEGPEYFVIGLDLAAVTVSTNEHSAIGLHRVHVLLKIRWSSTHPSTNTTIKLRWLRALIENVDVLEHITLTLSPVKMMNEWYREWNNQEIQEQWVEVMLLATSAPPSQCPLSALLNQCSHSKPGSPRKQVHARSRLHYKTPFQRLLVWHQSPKNEKDHVTLKSNDDNSA